MKFYTVYLFSLFLLNLFNENTLVSSYKYKKMILKKHRYKENFKQKSNQPQINQNQENSIQLNETNIHDDNHDKWRCCFRCGSDQQAAQKIQLKKQINLCSFVLYQFYLPTVKNSKDEEETSFKMCTQEFENSSGMHYQNAENFCKISLCGSPISREVLPPEDYKIAKNNITTNDISSNKQNLDLLLKMDPLIAKQFGDEELKILEQKWSKSIEKITEEQLLGELDRKLIQLKHEVCSNNKTVKENSKLIINKFEFFAKKLKDENSHQDNLKLIKLTLTTLTDFSTQSLDPFIDQLDKNLMKQIINLIKQLSKTFLSIEKKCSE